MHFPIKFKFSQMIRSYGYDWSTSSSIPDPYVTFTATRYEKIRGRVVVQAENPFRMSFQVLVGQSLSRRGWVVRFSHRSAEARHGTFSTFHMRIVVSSDADARYTLSEDHATSDNPCVWPIRFLMNSPVSGDQILTTFSAP